LFCISCIFFLIWLVWSGTTPTRIRLINRFQSIKIGIYFQKQCLYFAVFPKALLLFTLYTTSLSSLTHSHKFDHYLYADDTQVYISLSTADTDLSLKQLGDCISDISGWMTNNKLRFNANKTDFIIIVTSRQRCKLTPFFPRNILSHSITPSNTVRNLGVTFDRDFNFRKHVSLTCRSCFYHICDLRRIRRYISLSVAKTIATAFITSRLDYCNSLLYNIPSKDILKLQCVQNYLVRVVKRSPRFSVRLLTPCSISHHFSNSVLLTIKLFLLEILHIYFPNFL